MAGTREKSFEYEGRHLTVRAVAFDRGWKVRVFDGNQPATAVVYEVSFETAADAASSNGMSIDLVDSLMGSAEGDIVRGYVLLIAKK